MLHQIENKPFNVQGIDILPIDVLHYKLPVFGFRIKDFTYITDVNSIGDQEKEKIRGSKVLVLSALQKEDHISHFNLYQAIDLIKELNIPQAYLIHMSHRLGLHAAIEKELPAHIHLAYDGLKITV
jgi:phosphoribosyl 1,2-cyclic phosphate phosphodiesterase